MAALDFNGFQGARHFAGLDGLRAVAILAVVWHHSPHGYAGALPTRGFLGVDLFFVLSGFLITTLLIRERRQFGRISLGNFWARRFLRLMPAYYALLGAMAIGYLVFKPDSEETQTLLGGLHVYALYMSNWFNPGAPYLDPTWSLATEEQFYVAWPLVEAFATPPAIAAIWTGALAINQAVNFGMLDAAIAARFGVGPEGHPEILEATFTPILLGVGLAHLLAHARGFLAVRTIAGFRHAGFVWAAAALVIVAVPSADISGAQRLALHIAMTGLIAAVALAPGGGFARGLDWRPIAHVGAVSYGMYLYHLFGLEAAEKFLRAIGVDGGPAVFAVGALATIAVATASYLLLEKRFLALRSRFRAGQTPYRTKMSA